MRKMLLALLALTLSLTAAADTYDSHTLVAITTSGTEEVQILYSCRIDIVGRHGDVYKALLTPDQLNDLAARGLDIRILYDEMAEDRRLWAEADAAAAAVDAAGIVPSGRAPTFYYTASAFNTTNPGSTTLMKHLLDLHNAYPTITRLYDIGNSYGATYDILAIKVTKNPDIVEAEPKIRIYANIHGDEKGGLMVACEALDWILANYPADASARKLVDESEMWFIPMGNPDGNNSNSRYNGHGVDLNRNFWGPEGSSDGTGPFSEPETQSIRDLTEVANADHAKKRFANSLSFHGGEICFNSVWNYSYDAPTDEPIFWSSRTPGDGCSNLNSCLTLAPNGLAKAYQDGCTTSGFWYTDGADWYRTWGDTNDWAYGMWGDLDTTLEATLNKTPSAATIPTFVAEHRQAVINYMLKTFQGIHGIMTDGDTGAPLDGTVVVSATLPVPRDYRSVFTDPVVGDFHRVLLPGTYTVTCKAPGYLDTVVTGVVVTADTKSTCNCTMLGTTALHAAGSSFADLCSGVGSGGDGVLDPGEDATVSVTLANSGGRAATNVTGTLSTAVPGVTLVDDTASFANVPGSGTGASLAPNFTARVAGSVACGTVIPFTLHVVSDQGTWDDTLTKTVGAVAVGGGNLLAESFDGTTFPPTNWNQTDTSGTAGAWARSTATVHPSGTAPNTGAGLAYFNSYTAASPSATRMNRTAATAIPGTATAASASLWVYHETAYTTSLDRVQVQISTNGTTWTDVGTAVNRYDGTTGWKQHSVSLNSYIGQSVYIGFNGISAYGNDVHIDDVSLDYVAPGSCTAHTCTPSAAPKPVPDGKWVPGTPMKATRVSGSTVHVDWDVSTCAASGFSVYSGPLSAVSTLGYDTWTCGVGTTGSAEVAVSATGTDQFFVVVPTEGTVEGSHGRDSAGVERAGSGVGHCSAASKNSSGTCP